MNKVIELHLKIFTNTWRQQYENLITNNNIGNANKKCQQPNNGKLHIRKSANKPSSAKKKVAIIRDSVVKNIKHYQTNRWSFKGKHVSVKSFPSTTTRSMKHYVQPTQEENQPDRFFLHLETNDLFSANETKLRQKSWSYWIYAKD